MPDEKVVIVIAGKDDISKVLDKVGNRAKQTEKDIDKLGKRLQKAGKSMVDVGKKMSKGLTAPLGVFAAIAVNSAIKAERLTKTLQGLAGGADEAAGFINSIKDASQGTIPQIDALAIANKALAFGIVDSAAQMADLTEVAIALGRAQGVGAVEAVSDLTVALSRQSPMILDNLGITLKISEAHTIYAASIGKTVGQLSEAEKAEAFRTAALIKGKAVVEAMGGIQDDTAASGERLKASASDLALTVGNVLVPALNQAFDIIQPIIKAFTDADPATQQFAVGLGVVAAAAGPATIVLGKLTGLLGAIKTRGIASSASIAGLGVAIVGLVAAAKLLQDKLADMNEAQQEAVDTAATWSGKATELISKGATLSDVIGTMAGKTNDATDAWKDNIWTSILSPLGSQGKLLEVLAKTQDEVGKTVVANVGSYDEYTDAIDSYNSQVEDSNAKVKALTKTQFDWAKGALNQVKITKELSGQFAAGSVEARGFAEANAASAEAIEQTRDAIEEIIPAVEESGRAALMASESWDRHNVSIDQTVFEMESASDALGRLAPRFTFVEAELRKLSDTNTQAVGSFSGFSSAISATTGAIGGMLGGIGAIITEEERLAGIQDNLAAALGRGKQAAIESAESFVGLSESLLGATKAQIAQAVIGQLDPEALGAAGFAQVASDIQLAFGLADEKSIALAQNLPILTSAVNEGKVAFENIVPFVNALVTDAADGDVNMGNLMGKFAEAPGKIDPTKDSLGDTLEVLEDTTEILPDTIEGIDGFAGSVESAQEPLIATNNLLEDTKALLLELAGQHRIELFVQTTGNFPSTLPIGPIITPPGPGPGPGPAPGGPGAPVGPQGLGGGVTNNNTVNETNNFNISDPLGMALAENAAQQQRFDNLNGRM